VHRVHRGRHRELASATRPELAALGAVVGSLHARTTDDLAGHLGDTRTGVGYLDQWCELIAGYLPRLRRPLPPPLDSRVERALSSVPRILDGPLRRAAADDGGRPALLHGDITPGNVLWADRPVLIDWEYARLGDPADDVAYIFGQHGLSPLGSALWWLERWSVRSDADDAGCADPSTPKPARYYLEQAARRLELLPAVGRCGI
jgi:Ser/Thr protein kinase RdoA (MazF antagonist)